MMEESDEGLTQLLVQAVFGGLCQSYNVAGSPDLEVEVGRCGRGSCRHIEMRPFIGYL